jgi:hypothetical protein
MIFIDLDNTLYNQELYLKYVFKKIGKYIEENFDINSNKIYNDLMNITKLKTLRYPIFDFIINKYNLDIDSKKLVELYRKHNIKYLSNNKIKVYKSALRILKNYNCVIYTEGKKEIQEIKIRNIEKNYNLKLNYIIVENKLKEENIEIFNKYSPNLYIGDDVFVDFFIPNKLNILTVRVLTGIYSNIKNDIVDVDYRPKITIKNLYYLKI